MGDAGLERNQQYSRTCSVQMGGAKSGVTTHRPKESDSYHLRLLSELLTAHQQQIEESLIQLGFRPNSYREVLRAVCLLQPADASSQKN